jgi:hypothetical protein
MAAFQSGRERRALYKANRKNKADEWTLPVSIKERDAAAVAFREMQ